MSRKIKVRVWSKPQKRFLWKDEWFFDFDGSLYFWDIIENNLISVREVEYVVQQYTGLLDKNGVEIYEGDIFKGEQNKWDSIKFENGKFIVNLMGARVFDLDELFEDGHKPEVIGNIMENSELLK